jgi:hypothetical protein
MIAENPRLPRWVPGGHPMNPLGVRALYLGSSMYRIHGTDAPWTIGTAASKGCIRLYNQDVLDLYPRVHIGAKVTVTYQTFTTAPASPAAAVSSLSTALPGLPSLSTPSFFMLGDDEPAKPPKRSRAKSKNAAPSKSTSAHRRKTAVRSAAGKSAETSESAQLVGTAASP